MVKNTDLLKKIEFDKIAAGVYIPTAIPPHRPSPRPLREEKKLFSIRRSPTGTLGYDHEREEVRKFSGGPTQDDNLCSRYGLLPEPEETPNFEELDLSKVDQLAEEESPAGDEEIGCLDEGGGKPAGLMGISENCFGTDMLEEDYSVKNALPDSKPVSLKSKAPSEKEVMLYRLDAKEEKSGLTKSKEIMTLEQILSSSFGTPVSITRIKERPVTRKLVKEVYFLIRNGLSKVWVFKADPNQTLQELNAYYLIHQQGIPTGKPIGYVPDQKLKAYPFDVAILGGIVEHAGDPYNQLIENMVLSPTSIFQTARAIARIIADYQIKLSRVQEQFSRLGIGLSRADPGQEIKARLLPALKIEEEKASGLIAACRELYQKQSSWRVISHGDIHTDNIVTLSLPDAQVGAQTSIEKFGVIDWGTLSWDHPYGDVLDFWLHHQRKAKETCGQDYQFTIEQLLSGYNQELKLKLRGAKFEDNLQTGDPVIQSALWNLYEMYDPVRKSPTEIESKAKLHYRQLQTDLNRLESLGCREVAGKIKREMSQLLKDQTYLKRI